MRYAIGIAVAVLLAVNLIVSGSSPMEAGTGPYIAALLPGTGSQYIRVWSDGRVDIMEGTNCEFAVEPVYSYGPVDYPFPVIEFEDVELGGTRQPDSFFFALTLGTEKGRFNDILGKQFDIALNSQTLAGVPTIDDSFADAGTIFALLQHPFD